MSIIDVWLEYYPIFLKGALGTLEFAAIAVFFGTLIGTLIAIMHLSKFQVLQWIAKIYTTVLRGTPLLVQMYMAYFFIPMAFPVLDLPKEVCVVLSMVRNSSAYVSEIIRGGILSVDKGQTEAAKAIGMTHVQTMMNVILPQALRNIMPQIGNNLIINIKDTCVLSIIGIVELFYTTKGVAGAYYTYFESFTIAMVMYFILTFVCSRLLRLLEHKMEGPQNYDLATTDTLAHTSGLYSYPKKKEEK